MLIWCRETCVVFAYCAFLKPLPLEVNILRHPVAEGLVEPLGIVKMEVPCKKLIGFFDRLVVLQIYLLVFDRPPEPLDEDIVEGALSNSLSA